jgi:hypothetical protein
LQALDYVPNSRLSQLKECIEKKTQKDGSVLRIEDICDGHSDDYKEFYFNKDPDIVGIILKFYENDIEDHKTHINFKNACALDLEAAFKYWKIDYEHHLYVCCLREFCEKKENESYRAKHELETIAAYNLRENFGKRFYPNVREKIWHIMEVPRSSVWAKIYIAFSSVVICFSSLSIVLS